jgi:hypothetical protein
MGPNLGGSLADTRSKLLLREVNPRSRLLLLLHAAFDIWSFLIYHATTCRTPTWTCQTSVCGVTQQLKQFCLLRMCICFFLIVSRPCIHNRCHAVVSDVKKSEGCFKCGEIRVRQKNLPHVRMKFTPTLAPSPFHSAAPHHKHQHSNSTRAVSVLATAFLSNQCDLTSLPLASSATS